MARHGNHVGNDIGKIQKRKVEQADDPGLNERFRRGAIVESRCFSKFVLPGQSKVENPPTDHANATVHLGLDDLACAGILTSSQSKISPTMLRTFAGDSRKPWSSPQYLNSLAVLPWR